MYDEPAEGWRGGGAGEKGGSVCSPPSWSLVPQTMLATERYNTVVRPVAMPTLAPSEFMRRENIPSRNIPNRGL